jgi:hypothetical protein
LGRQSVSFKNGDLLTLIFLLVVVRRIRVLAVLIVVLFPFLFVVPIDGVSGIVRPVFVALRSLAAILAVLRITG